MNYIITESRLESTIYEYLNKTFDVDDINWHHPYDYNDETGEEGDDENRIEFYIGDFDEGDNVCFRWYACDYFTIGGHARSICPTIQIESPYDNILNGYFGDLWHEPFKKWIKDNFDIDVKTVESW